MIKTLEIKTSMLFNLDFTSKTISSCFFFFFLIIDFSILAVIAHIYNCIAELVTLTAIPIKEAKPKIKTYPITAEAKIREF